MSIRLNVGGTLFETTPETLSPSPVLTKLISKKFKEDSRQILFIDRDPKGFSHVLSLLRDQNYPFPLKYAHELEHYGINTSIEVDEDHHKIDMNQSIDLGTCSDIPDRSPRSFLLEAFPKTIIKEDLDIRESDTNQMVENMIKSFYRFPPAAYSSSFITSNYVGHGYCFEITPGNTRADVIDNIWLYFEVEDVPLNSEGFPYAMIKEIELNIGGSRIDKQYGLLMYILRDTSIPPGVRGYLTNANRFCIPLSFFIAKDNVLPFQVYNQALLYIAFKKNLKVKKTALHVEGRILYEDLYKSIRSNKGRMDQIIHQWWRVKEKIGLLQSAKIKIDKSGILGGFIFAVKVDKQKPWKFIPISRIRFYSGTNLWLDLPIALVQMQMIQNGISSSNNFYVWNCEESTINLSKLIDVSVEVDLYPHTHEECTFFLFGKQFRKLIHVCGMTGFKYSHVNLD